MGVGSCMDFGVSTYALCTILKNELGKILETGFKKIVIMADMDFGACDCLCTIFKKKVRKLVETCI